MNLSVDYNWFRHSDRFPEEQSILLLWLFFKWCTREWRLVLCTYVFSGKKRLTDLNLLGQALGLHDCASVVPPVWGGQSEVTPVEHSLRAQKRGFLEKTKAM